MSCWGKMSASSPLSISMAAAIGDNTTIGTFVEIQKGAVIGKNCKISSHSFICEGVTIQDEVFIGHSVTFTNDRFPARPRQTARCRAARTGSAFRRWSSGAHRSARAQQFCAALPSASMPLSARAAWSPGMCRPAALLRAIRRALSAP